MHVPSYGNISIFDKNVTLVNNFQSDNDIVYEFSNVYLNGEGSQHLIMFNSFPVVYILYSGYVNTFLLLLFNL